MLPLEFEMSRSTFEARNDVDIAVALPGSDVVVTDAAARVASEAVANGICCFASAAEADDELGS